MNELAVMMQSRRSYEDEQLREVLAASLLAKTTEELLDEQLIEVMKASAAAGSDEPEPETEPEEDQPEEGSPPNKQLVSNVGHTGHWCDGLSDDEICAALCKATQEDENMPPNGKKLTDCGSMINGLLNVCFLKCVFNWLIERDRITNPMIKIFCRDLSHCDTMCPKPVIGKHPLTPAQHEWIAQVFQVRIIVHDMGNLVNKNPCEPEYAQRAINDRSRLPTIELALRGGHYYLLEDI